MKEKESLILITHKFLCLFDKYDIEYKLLKSDDYFAVLWFNNSCRLKISYNDCTKHFRTSFTNIFINETMDGVFDGRLVGIEDHFNEYILPYFKVIIS